MSLIQQDKNSFKKSVKVCSEISKHPLGPDQFRKLACSYSFKNFIEALASKLHEKIGSKNMSIPKRVFIKDVPQVHYTCVVSLGTIVSSLSEHKLTVSVVN